MWPIVLRWIRMKINLVILIVFAFVTPTALTQTAAEPQPQENAVREAKPDEIPFTYDRDVFGKVEVESVPKMVAAGPDEFPADTPAHSCFHLHDKRPLPAFEKGPRYFYPAYSTVCIIPLSDQSVADFAKSYPTINEAAAKLRKLLKAHPARFRFYNDLFDLPYNNATGAIQSRVEYLPFKSGNGVMFLTQYSQELHPNPVNNEELTCNFQGLSTDGKYYVAARLTLTHPSLPKGIDFTDKIRRDNKRLYLRKQERLLNTYAEDSFQPSLRTIKSLISSISIQ